MSYLSDALKALGLFRVSLVVLVGLVIPAALTARADLTIDYTQTAWVTWAGVQGGWQDGVGVDARLLNPSGVAVASDGVLYVTDTGHHTIRKIEDGVTTTFAGSPGVFGATDGPGPIARFRQPLGIAVDQAHNVYVADSLNHSIRKIDSTGNVSTLAGLAGFPGSVDGTGAGARFNTPSGVVVDGAGNVFVADTNNHRIRKITPGGAVTTFAGSTSGHVDATGTAAQFGLPYGLAFKADGTLVVSDAIFNFSGGSSIRLVSPAGAVTTLVDGSAWSFWPIKDIAVDGAGNILVGARPSTGSSIHSIYAIGPDGVLTPFAVSNPADFLDGPLGTARFRAPISIDVDNAGNVYLADADNQSIRKIAAGVMSTMAGLPAVGTADGIGTSAQFDQAAAIVEDGAGGAFVAGSASIRHISSTAVVTTFAGNGTVAGHVDGTGLAARFLNLRAMTRATDGTLYVTDGGYIRSVTAAGVVSTIAGQNTPPSFQCVDGVGSAARFGQLGGIAVAPSGMIWAADRGCNSIRTIALDGTVTTILGLFTARAVAFGADGAAYVADAESILRVASDLHVTNFVGIPNSPGFVDGHGTNARFHEIATIASNSSGVFIVSDRLNHAIRIVFPNGDVVTAGGNGGFFDPFGVAIDGSGMLYVADNTLIKRGHPDLVLATSITSHPASSVVTVGGSATFTAAAFGIPAPTYQWQSSADGSSWSDLSNSAPYSNTTGQTLVITSAPSSLSNRQYRLVASNSSGSATSAPAKLTVMDVVVQPGALAFGAAKTSPGGALVFTTAPQAVTVAFPAATAAVDWTATVNQPWLALTNGSGHGSGQFTVGIDDPGNTIGGAPDLAAFATIAFDGLPTVTVPIVLTVAVNATATGAKPFGQIDAPVQNATVAGAIGVSGWALDDVGVSGVKIYRNCLPEEPQSNCISGAPYNISPIVFIGDAAILEGARPDVAAAFPLTPESTRAGWGLMVLTNMLPSTQPVYSPFGGQGQLRFYAVAFDAEGQGRALQPDWTWNFPVSGQTVNLQNQSINKPFGTIDTPGQGELITTSSLANFGWALTPDPGNGTSIPTDGSTMFVFVDGVPLGNVVYNQCRGDVGNPPGPTTFCDDDVANVFGNPTPLPPLTKRTSNPTIFRNLDVGRGAIGSFEIDLSTYEPGLHTIAWSVTDSANRVEGIGSRFFRVLPPPAPIAPKRGSSPRAATSKTPLSPLQSGSASLAARVAGRRNGRSLVRTGFDLEKPYTTLAPLIAEHSVTIPQMGRVEAHVDDVVSVERLDAPAGDRLPVGARWDRDADVFTWVPPAGFIGTYRFAFERSSGRFVLVVNVTAN